MCSQVLCRTCPGCTEEQYRERAYFSQEMKVSKYELYREDSVWLLLVALREDFMFHGTALQDIKDLTDLTVSKMDVPS